MKLEKNMPNWQKFGNPFQEFTEEITREWMKADFTCMQARKWLNIGLEPKDANYAWWIRNKAKKSPEQFLTSNKQDLRKQYKVYLENQSDSNDAEKCDDEDCVNAQEWLNEHYPKEERKKIKELDISNEKLKGDLDLVDFINLKEININGNPQLGRIKNKKFSTKVKATNAQQWLKSQEEYNTKEKRAKVEKIDFNYRDLEGDLDLNDFENLEEVKLKTNNITKITLSPFTDEKLKILTLSGNNHLGKGLDLTYFSRFSNLDTLKISATSFSGSLKPLEKLTKLKRLDVRGTDIDSGLEYLPGSIEKIYCNSDDYPNLINSNPQVFKIYKELATCDHDIKTWRKCWKIWKKKGFNNQEIRQLIEAGLKISEWYFADYLKRKNYSTFESDLEELKREMNCQGQIWLDKNYPKEKREKVKEITDINSKKLKGKLNLTSFSNLQKLDCHGNEFTGLDLSKNTKISTLNFSFSNLTDLDLTNCENIQSIDARFNQLSDISFLEKLPNPEKLKVLSLGFNNIHSDLTPFSRFTNLEYLSLGTFDYDASRKDFQSQESDSDDSDKKILESKRENFDKFYGSLKSLKKLNQLKKLDISNTNIDGGLEYLPISVREIYCSSKERSEARVKEIEEMLKNSDRFNFNNGKYVREFNSFFVENLKTRIADLKKEKEGDSCHDGSPIYSEVTQRKIDVCENLIKAWEKPLELPTAEEFDKIREEVVGFEEFIEEISNYLKVTRKPRLSGEKIVFEQRFYLLLGRPGIGKSYIAEKIAKYLGKQFININCANADLSELVGFPKHYVGSDFGKITRGMAEKQDRAPVILFDEIDKCKVTNAEKEILNTISILFDDTKNKTDFDDKFLQLTIPMNEVFFIATANSEEKLPDFIRSRCVKVSIEILTWGQRMEIVRREAKSQLKYYELEQYFPLVTDELLKKLLVKEWGIRHTKINIIKFMEQLDDLDTKCGGNLEENLGKINIHKDLDLVNYPWKGLIESNGLDPNCPAISNRFHKPRCECFFPEQVPGWEENRLKSKLQKEINSLEKETDILQKQLESIGSDSSKEEIEQKIQKEIDSKQKKLTELREQLENIDPEEQFINQVMVPGKK